MSYLVLAGNWYDLNQLPAFLSLVEGPIPKLYNDGSGNPTIGIGLNLNVPSDMALVLNLMAPNLFSYAQATYGYSPQTVVNAFEAVLSSPADKLPITRKSDATGNPDPATQTLQTALNALLAEYLGVSVGSLQYSFSHFPSSLITTSLSEALAGGALIANYPAIVGYSQQALNYLTSAGVPTANLPPSNSGAWEALVSLYFNQSSSNPLLGMKLIAALTNSNLAQAWYEIRYDSNGGASSGVARRRYLESQLFGLSQPGDTWAQALQAYEVLTSNRTKIFTYEQLYGTDPDTIGNPNAPAKVIASANSWAGSANPTIAAPATPVPTLTQAFNAEADLLIPYLQSTYASVLPTIVNATDGGPTNGTFVVRSTDIFVAPTQAEISAGFATSKYVDAAVGDPGAYGKSEAYSDHILIGTGEGDSLEGGLGNDILVAGSGNETLQAGAGSDTLIGGAGNDVLCGGAGNDLFDCVFNGSGGKNTIVDSTGNGSLYINGAQFTVSGALSKVSANVWIDGAGNTYTFTPGPQIPAGDLPTFQAAFQMSQVSNLSQWIGELSITGPGTGSNTVNIIGFNLQTAQTAGFLGIKIPQFVNLTAGATIGVDPPATFPSGSLQSYTFSLDAPSTTAQTVTLMLAGAPASDFEAMIGQNIVQLNANGTFTVTLPAGQTNVAFELLNTTALAQDGTLLLSASIPNPSNPNGSPVTSTPLTIDYQSAPPDTSTPPQPTNTITGTYNSQTSITSYLGDGGNDSIVASSPNDYIQATNSVDDSIIGGSGSNTIDGGSGHDVINLNGTQDAVSLGHGYNTVNGGTGHDTVFGDGTAGTLGDDITAATPSDDIIIGNGGTDLLFAGSGSNQIFAGAQTTVQNAIASLNSVGASGQQGDLLSVLDGNNTIIGGTGNDAIVVGTGSNIVVMGPGSDTFNGGIEATGALANWSVTVTQTASSFVETDTNLYEQTNGYVNPYPQPYNGFSWGNNASIGTGNDTVYGGSGNDYIFLPNGNNYAYAGTGNTSVFGGMGNDTIIAGSGSDLLQGGGGTTYIYGGSGADTIYGGDGNNTIIGGSGNATIKSASGPIAYNYDASGNRTAEVNKGTATFYAIDQASNQILTQSHRASAIATNAVAAITNLVIVGGPPTVTISVSPATIESSQSATLTWSSTGASACTASGVWSGAEATSGSQNVFPSAAGTDTYTLTCTGSGGSGSNSATLTVSALPKGTILYSYDANGSLLSDGVFRYSYDAAGRLAIAQKTPAGASTPSVYSSYTYNGLNQRVQMLTSSSGQITLIYDEAGHLLGHYTHAPDAVETVWLGDIPLAVVKAASTYFIHADYLNTPRQIDNASGQAAWVWEPVTFGDNAPNTDPRGTGTAFDYRLRFPGQVADAEPGLRYNYYRDYNPALGRYAQSDPIGLFGGSYSPYAYARGNPVSLTDPLGLWTLQAGLTLNLQLGFINLNGTYGIVVDSSGNIASYVVGGIDGGAGADAFGGLNIAISNGDCNQDIGGPFGNVSSSLGTGLQGGLDAFTGQGSHGQTVSGAGFSIGVGAGAQYSIGGSQTVVTPLWHF